MIPDWKFSGVSWQECLWVGTLGCVLQWNVYSKERFLDIVGQRELTLGWSSRGHLICLNIDFRAGVFEGQDLHEESVYAQKCSLYKSLVKN